MEPSISQCLAIWHDVANGVLFHRKQMTHGITEVLGLRGRHCVELLAVLMMKETSDEAHQFLLNTMIHLLHASQKKFRDVRWWSSIPPQQKDRMIHTRQLFSYYMPHKKIQRCHSDISAKPEQQTLMDWTDFKRQLFFIPKLNDLWISSVIKKTKSHDDLYT